MLINLTNFKVVQPDEQLIEQFLGAGGEALFMMSDEGEEWYSSQQLFSDDTIKIAYDADNIICSVVDRPDADGKYDVSLLVPVNLSVTEISPEDYPDGVTLDGTWKCDGLSVWRDEELVNSGVLAANMAQKENLLALASSKIAPLQDAVELGIATDEERSQLLEWKKYRVKLNRIEPGDAPDINWPEKPE